MARYEAERKARTREAIVRAAARAVREAGPDGISVAEVMAEAGLTHGGFYAHFPSKSALVAEAVVAMFEGGARRMREALAGRDGFAAFDAFVDLYLSRAHCDHPGEGCPLTTLAVDAGRAGGEVAACFAAGLEGMIGGVAEMLLIDEDGPRRSLAASLVAELAGAVTLARATRDTAVSDEILSACRARVKARARLASLEPQA